MRAAPSMILLFALLLLSGSPGASFAATYYVDPAAGSDTFDGLSRTLEGASNGPWQHIPGSLGVPAGGGWVRAQAGDSIVVKGGSVLPDSIQVDTSWYAGGAPGKLITILSGDRVGWGTGRAVIDGGAGTDGTGTWAMGFHIIGPSYIRIEGFEIRNMANLTNSAGVYIDGNKTADCQIVGNLIHDIYGAPGPGGYGIEVTGAVVVANMLIEGNVIYHTEEKAIELYRQGYSTIRFNYLFQTNDHAVVVSSSGNAIYDNLISQAGYAWLSYELPFRPAFGFKFAGDSVVSADNNVMYDNLVLDCSSGIGILNGNNNKVYFNTVYHSGFQGREAGGFEGAAFVIEDQGTAGSNVPTGNDVRNNIFYYGNIINGRAQTVAFNSRIGGGNVISHNVIYRDPLNLASIVYFEDPSGSHWHSADWFQGASGFSAFASGNVASGNVIADPGLAGGTGASLLAVLPNGLDANGHPDSPALSLTADSPPEVLHGDTLGAPFTLDITGRVRTLFSLGAYEQTQVAVQGPPAPTGLRIRR